MKSGKAAILFFMIFGFLVVSGGALADSAMPGAQPPAYEELFEGFVYYADSQKTALKSEKRWFSSSLDFHELGKQILTTLIEGPSQVPHQATWPSDTKIKAFFITDSGDAFVDLDVNDEKIENMDTLCEFLAVYSMVNSLTLNIAKIKQVKILIQGKDAKTLAGHIGLEHFYRTNMLIVK
ncbi:MAG: GerMN domain-containing protein [Proteobacteria bacterium]|nr:GerMN domain-containing protein [Pseudomonadota bacterium]MBU1389022.1 GerMN domain-containing protein [Pseudomonadota bacterium]MBU1543574.1 GerMN domain-containing protein [Pseudomonadota bacterium]MBU2481434.1 GerMN domain-containing protein [Pseudomonadota bacterium]